MAASSLDSKQLPRLHEGAVLAEINECFIKPQERTIWNVLVLSAEVGLGVIYVLPQNALSGRPKTKGTDHANKPIFIN